MKIRFYYLAETKTCYRFQAGERPDIVTLYLKKKAVDEAGIEPLNGVDVTIEGVDVCTPR